MHVTTVHDPAALERLRSPRNDVVIEREDGPDRFVAARGPFRRYERTLAVGTGGVVETTTFALAVPFWWLLFALPYRWAMRRPVERRDRSPWWAPPDPPDGRAATSLGMLCSLGLIDGYVGTLLTQTITYSAREFGADRAAQGTVLAVVRAGALVALAAGALADRRGRRRTMLVCATGACVFAAMGALAPNFAVLTVTQLAAAGCAGALGVLLAIVSAEEVPAGTRAYALSLLVMTGALGAGMCVWALPLADTGTRGWRAVYALALLGLVVVVLVRRRLPESRRYEERHAAATAMSERARRLALLAAIGFLAALFIAPAFQFQNDFLRRERGFSAARIALFTVVTSTPASIGIVAGGRLSDVHGRRVVGVVGLLGGTAATVAVFAAHGWPMWAWAIAGGVVGGLVVPALGVYRPELFPTALRGRAAGVLEVIALAGSATGLLTVGHLADRWGSYTGPIAIAGCSALAVAVLVLLLPETAGHSLEHLNPEDVLSGPSAASP